MEVEWIPGSGFLANSYVFGPILVDAGVTPMAVERFKERIEIIAITHGHFDHIAHLAEIAHMCDAEVCIHEEDAPALTDERLNLSLLFGERCAPAVQVRSLHEGERIGGLTVLHTPGHTPGSISLYCEEERILFSGDTVFTGGGMGRTDFPGGNLDQLRSSIARLAEMEVEGLYPGHGEPVPTGGHRHISAALEMLRGFYV